MSHVLLYPARQGAGGPDRSVPSPFKEKFAKKLVKSGYWSYTPDLADPKVSQSIIERAQVELSQGKAINDKRASELNEREAELKKQFEAIQKAKAELEAKAELKGKAKTKEV